MVEFPMNSLEAMNVYAKMQNEPILIVGATHGIGRRLAERLISAGRSVISAGRTVDAPQGVLKHVVFNAIEQVLPTADLPDALGGLVYCPGSIDLKPMRVLKADDLRVAFEINVVGAFQSIQVCLDRLKRCPSSGIVLFSTVAVQRGMAFHAGVAAAKGAVEGLTRSLSAELAPVVRVNCIAPGLTRTGLSERLLNTPEKEKASADRHPMKRVGEPDDIAAMAQFLLSKEATWITGQVFGVDGGMSTI